MVGYHKLRARRAGQRAATSTSTCSSAPARRSSDAHAIAHELRDAIEARSAHAEVLIHIEPEESFDRPEEPRAATGRAERRVRAG